MLPPSDPERPAGVDAGPFGEWLAAMRAVLRGERSADVPCGSCVGCCVSSYPIPLRPGDEVAREQVPEQWLLEPALPGERWLMGFREDGSCPFLEAKCCSIYADRPQTCRDYDCRIYAAAGLMPDGDRPVIAERVRAWEFAFSSEQERRDAEAMRCAARFIRQHQAQFPQAMRAGSATAAAVLAVKTYVLFVSTDMGPTAEMVGRVIDAAKAFDSA
ncbi:MAG: YkgJ family cysteine cluster protein [Steroidobacteraceae bacterium]